MAPAIASASPGQSCAPFALRWPSTSDAPGSAAMAGVPIACDSRDDGRSLAPARLRDVARVGARPRVHRGRVVGRSARAAAVRAMAAARPRRRMVARRQRRGAVDLRALRRTRAARRDPGTRAHGGRRLVRRHGAGRWRRAIDRYGEAILGVLPWALFVVASSALPRRGARWPALEAFPDTFNPLYFLIRCRRPWLLGVSLVPRAGAGSPWSQRAIAATQQ